MNHLNCSSNLILIELFFAYFAWLKNYYLCSNSLFIEIWAKKRLAIRNFVEPLTDLANFLAPIRRDPYFIISDLRL